MNNELYYKSEGVRDCVKWVIKRIKEKQKYLNNNDWYYIPEAKMELEYAIKELISVKISLEKYMKKLIHQSKEEN